jgi:nitroimidazol reductase NimA-like FMN-containing flavoprotein (pyridoxamine 5'-phosphate oxidase superfamily)
VTGAQPSWAWVEERLRTCHNYWLATASPEHGPYVRPVWCLWGGGTLLFTASATSRKARDFTADPRVSVQLELVREVVVLDGDVEAAAPDAAAVAAYEQKYGWRPLAAQRWYRVRPRSCYAAIEETYPASAIRFDL